MSPSTRNASILAILAVLAALLFWRLRPQENDRDDTATSGTDAPTDVRPRAPRAPAPQASESPPPRKPIALQPAVSGHDADATHGAFAGRVIDWGTGRGVAGAEVVFSGGDDALTVESTKDGSFVFAPKSVGRYKLAVASADGYLPFAPAWDDSTIELVARAQTRVEGIVIYLTPAINYTGVVVDTDGKPVAGAKVTLEGARSGNRTLLPIDDSFTSGDDGSFQFHAPDFAQLTAEHECCGKGLAFLDGAAQISRRLEIRLDDHPITRLLSHGEAPETGSARIRGRVSAGDKPVPAFSVAVIRTNGLRTSVVALASFFDGQGSFEIGGLVPGEYGVQVMAHGYARSEPVPAVASDSPREVVVELPRGGTLRGVVLDAATKAPLELAKVTLEGSVGGGAAAVPMSTTAITDADGRFELRGLPEGRVSVVVAAYDHHQRIVGGMDVRSGAALAPITVELTPLEEGETPRLELAGIGAALGAAEDGLAVTKLFEGGGAAEAGIVVGDVITAVDGKKVVDLGFQDTIQAIRGIEGSTVTLTVRRANGQVGDVVATRRKIRA